MDAILYHGEPNGPSLAVLAALGESGLAIETRAIDLLAGERHTLPGVNEPLARDMGVEGEGPVLVIDGEAMAESVFIAQYLDEVGAGTLQTKDPYDHWQMLMWCRRVTERCAPAAAFLGCRAYSSGKLGAPEIASEDLAARWQAVRDGNFPEEQVGDSIRHVTATAQMVEDQLADGREWLMNALSIADFETYGWLAGMINVLPTVFDDKPNLQAWLDRVLARPSVQAALARATVADPRQSWAPGPEINRWG
jgi:GSH-dependent disulfide-bond oxidoreductase